MGEYEPHDSRNVTLKQERAPGEPPRTGPREGETRQPEAQETSGQTELEGDERGEEVEQTVDAEQQQAEEEQREAGIASDEDELGDRND